MGGQGPRQNLGIRRRERRKEMGGEMRENGSKWGRCDTAPYGTDEGRGDI